MGIDYENELNPEQYEAVTSIDGPLLIIAGAGSGKTRVITFRMAYMLEKGISQNHILALTFTNKAAREMESRVKELTARKLQNLTVSTFHAFGVRVLRQDIERLGWRPNFSIYDETDRNQLIKDAGRYLRFTSDALDVMKIGSIFSNVKCGRWDWQHANDQYRRFYEEYNDLLKLHNALDFDDLIALPMRLFRENPDVLEKYRDRYRYILVDEFQDTSAQQYELLHMLASKNVAVVGDDDQSIYSWRGADYENLRCFERDFPGVREIRLEQNYRSTETILAAANGVISHNTNRKDKALWSGKGTGKPIELFTPENEGAEAAFIAESIHTLRLTEKRHFEDFAVLMRANTQSRAIEEAFLAANIPYTMSGGTSFFQRKEIKDIISYLRVIANHDDDVNLLRIINTPRRGIGRKALEELGATANAARCSIWQSLEMVQQKEERGLFDSTDDGEEREGSAGEGGIAGFCALIRKHRKLLLSGKGLSAKIRSLLEEIGYFDYILVENAKNDKAARYKLLNIEHLLSFIGDWEANPDTEDPSLFSYLNRITLLSRDDLAEDGLSGKVSLMTIHASKGLEFPVVFIAGAEEGLIPHARSLEDDLASEEDTAASGAFTALEEERRLFYVAITRARDKLFITSCLKRRRMQTVSDAEQSRFISEIPDTLVEIHDSVAAAAPVSPADSFNDLRKRLEAKKKLLSHGT